MSEVIEEVGRTSRQALRIGRILAAALIATLNSGCATLMQPFSAVQPTAALVEPDGDSGSSIPDNASERFASASVDSAWSTRVYPYRSER